MKKTIFLGLMLISGISYSQNYRTGDAELDASLRVVNTEGKKDLPAFKLDLTKRFNVTLAKVESCFKVGMDAADAFMALQVANLAKRPIEDVITVYKKSKSKGWGAMAKELGIKPGSAEFHALKGKAKDKAKGNSKSKDSKTTGGDKKESTGKSNGKSSGNSGKSNGNGNGKGNGKAKK